MTHWKLVWWSPILLPAWQDSWVQRKAVEDNIFHSICKKLTGLHGALQINWKCILLGDTDPFALWSALISTSWCPLLNLNQFSHNPGISHAFVVLTES